MKRALFLLACCFFSACLQSQEAADQAALRRLFSLPDGAQIIEYNGFPGQVGFGQREGLRLLARYRLTPEQMREWAETAPGKGWTALPISPGARERMEAFKFEGLDSVRQGLYFCQTAGDDVLHAHRTRPCAAAERQNDIIAGLADTASGEVKVQVESFY